MESPFDIRVNIAQLLKEPVGSTREYVLEAIASKDITRRVSGNVRLIRTKLGVIVRGKAAVRETTYCSRCLEAVELDLDIDMDEEFCPSIDVITGLPLTCENEFGVRFIDEEHVLDLGEILRQYVILALPMKPLCRSDCAGLCVNCGCNLNDKSCKCVDRVPE
jgi:uncharacterized protein